MADITLPATNPANVSTPAANSYSYFIESVAGKPALKNSLGFYTYMSPWGSEATVAASAAINTAVTQITPVFKVPIGSGMVQTTYRVTIIGTCTSTVANASTFTLRFGTTGAVGDAAICTVVPTAAASGTGVVFKLEFWITVRTVGGTGSVIASGFLANSGVTGISATTNVGCPTPAAVAISTLVDNFISVWYSSAAITTTSTFQQAIIEPVRA